MIDILHKIIRRLFGQKASHASKVAPNTEGSAFAKTRTNFDAVIVMDKTPRNDAVGERDFVLVVYQRKPLWALFRCPCGCGNVISLSLQKIHNPNWRVRKNRVGLPTVYPSIWQNQGCCCHFWIKDGCVRWCFGAAKRLYDR